jgi:hypothetical protein
MGVVTVLFMALDIALFTCVVSGWALRGGLTSRMRVCVLSPLFSRIPSPVVYPLVHIHLWPMLVCVVFVRVCHAPLHSPICAE